MAIIKEWYDKGYKAGCEYLSKCSDVDLLDWYDLYKWDPEHECEESLSFSEGYGAAYGCDEEEE